VVTRRVVVITLVLTWVWFATPARAAESLLSATVTPSELTLPRGASATGVLAVSNAGSPAVTVDVHPSATDPSVSVAMTKARLRVPAGGATSVTYRVERSSEGTGQDVTVWFLVTYLQAATGTSKPVSHLLVVTSTVKAAASLSLMTATVESNVANINENRSGEAALVISNPRETPLVIRAIHVTVPSGVNITFLCPGGHEKTAQAKSMKPLTNCPSTVDPRSQQVVSLIFKAESSVTPGPRTVIFRIDGQTPEGDLHQSVVASSAFTVDVFAESDILKVIGAPTFLLVPGVIVLLTAWALIRYASPWRHQLSDKSFPNPITAATVTAIGGVFISLVVATLYPALTRNLVPGEERNYLKAYGFRDFYYVFGYSFAIAVAIWVLAALVFVLARGLLYVSWVQDDPQSLLRKIALRGLPRLAISHVRGKAPPNDSAFPSVELNGADGKFKGKALLLKSRLDDKVFLAPPISVQIQPDVPAVKSEIEGEKNSVRLWQKVRDAVRGSTEGTATIVFQPNCIPAPIVAERGLIRRTGQEAGIVSFPAKGD
jgi:uncharacterized membrane protein